MCVNPRIGFHRPMKGVNAGGFTRKRVYFDSADRRCSYCLPLLPRPSVRVQRLRRGWEGRLYHSAATAMASTLLGSMSGFLPGVLSVRPSSSTSNMLCGGKRRSVVRHRTRCEPGCKDMSHTWWVTLYDTSLQQTQLLSLAQQMSYLLLVFPHRDRLVESGGRAVTAHTDTDAVGACTKRGGGC